MLSLALPKYVSQFSQYVGWQRTTTQHLLKLISVRQEVDNSHSSKQSIINVYKLNDPVGLKVCS